MRFAFTDRTALKIKPLSDRKHDLGLSIISELNTIKKSEVDKKFRKVAKRIIFAKKEQSISNPDDGWSCY